MLSSLACGDLELNIMHPNGMPTLVPSPGLEQRLDWRLHKQSEPTRKGRNSEPETDKSPLPPLAVHLHVHYLETLPTLLDALSACQSGLEDLRLWISTDTSAKADSITKTLLQSPIAEQARSTEVRVCPNRGRNLGPLLQHLWPELQQEALVLHLHGKRSLETDIGEAWLAQLLKRLLPDGKTIQALRQRFHKDPQLGLVMPQPPELIRPYLNWGNNFELAHQLLKPLDRRLHRDAVLMFPAGGMFWARPAALAPLTQCFQSLQELPPEPLPIDGSSLHAMERVVAHACEASGHLWQLFCENPSAPSTTGPTTISVLKPQTETFEQATALLAAHLRQQDEQLQCAQLNLDRCTQQLESAEATIQQLITTTEELNKLNNTMASSRTWKLRRLLKRLVRAKT
ncbi:rhamnan synthesis F family protein [Synechococcus sp. MIT S9504]|uniref:rhamnan synthesis F family protein n=1 Tax=Synechococcus sp. MIT S9504 TaxID=1801628 RepID=UPI0007BBAB24|nr:rhamnan synthesis F family protein [Synechococcus sp. MIT S9504]KZR84319.1 Rhamnan synthesis protein F [Synechococcus sp. MIT S9504]